MFPYENVKSIHDQKMAQFISAKEKVQMARMRKAGRQGLVERWFERVSPRFRSIGSDRYDNTQPAI